MRLGRTQPDRNRGSTAPETEQQSSSVDGRPDDSDNAVGFHAEAETPAVEREAFSGEEVVREGRSFDGPGVPSAAEPVDVSQR